MSDSTPIDLAAAAERFGGPDRWQRLLDIYLDDTGQRVERIAAAIDSGDVETIRKEAHSIKGASAQLQAEPMRAAAAAAENAARAGDSAAAIEAARAIAPEFERFRAHVTS